MLSQSSTHQVIWAKPPDDFELLNDPVDNINQPALGVWQGSRANRQGYWLRWWDEQGNLLLWETERIERLTAQLRSAGIAPNLSIRS